MSTTTKVVLGFTDGVEHELLVQPGHSVLDAALEGEVPILFQCRTGSCGSCLARLVEGKAEHRSGLAVSLLPASASRATACFALPSPRANAAFRLPMTAPPVLADRLKPSASSTPSSGSQTMSSASNSNWPKAIPWISVLASLSRSRCRGRKSCAAIRWRRWPPIFPESNCSFVFCPAGSCQDGSKIRRSRTMWSRSEGLTASFS
jgi:ferredoxin